MSGPRVYDGTKWVSQTEEAYQGVTPPPQEHGGDGKIFVAIPSFRGWYSWSLWFHSV